MKIEVLDQAMEDLFDGYLFYERQEATAAADAAIRAELMSWGFERMSSLIV